jgi:hypothetical protein
MKEIYRLFLASKNYSSKYKKYFEIYEDLFKRFKDKDITFVEIGIQNGGSLEIWKKYFGKNSRIIGIDFNSECKKFEKDNIIVEIGSQSDPEFWNNFFLKYGFVDIILDDGGHTNHQQITTVINCIKNIKNNGLLITEDTHSSYMRQFDNPSKYSFINFTKKSIDDINYKFPDIGYYKSSINNFVYSIEFFESIVAFKVNRERCEINTKLHNSGITSNIKDMRFGEYTSSNIFFFRIKKIIKEMIRYLELAKYFK